MIAAANPHAAEAGLAVLRRGGSAVDAAIAAALVLGPLEPQASGLGGGGYLMHWSAAGKRVDSYDGRVTAPAAVRADHFLGPDGKPRDRDAVAMGGILGRRAGVRSGSSRWRTPGTASCRGRTCSNPPSRSPKKASRCRRASISRSATAGGS